MNRCVGPRIGRVQIPHESAESGTATIACMDSALLLTYFPLVIHQLFLYDWYSQVLNKNECAVSVLGKLGTGVMYVVNTMSEQIKAGLRLRAHAG